MLVSISPEQADELCDCIKKALNNELPQKVKVKGRLKVPEGLKNEQLFKNKPLRHLFAPCSKINPSGTFFILRRYAVGP